MSGDGVVSVRLPRSLLGAFRDAADQRGLTIHTAAQHVVAALSSLTPDDLRSLSEPPREIDTPRVSLYVGWRYVDALTAATRNSPLSVSSIFRRLLFGLLICKTVEFVQPAGKSNYVFRLINSQQDSPQVGRKNGRHEHS